MSNIECFKKAKLQQFNSLANSEEAKTEGIIAVLERANYRIERVGTIVRAQKGKAIISYITSFDSKVSDAMVTLIPC